MMMMMMLCWWELAHADVLWPFMLEASSPPQPLHLSLPLPRMASHPLLGAGSASASAAHAFKKTIQPRRASWPAPAATRDGESGAVNMDLRFDREGCF
ncbi:hypothetical protein BJ875DRAFT_470782 [Amylocarpus encephaloides]|uniref:Secreted protein n=1 Tax=Amylocarpus encephaloides TaxID=45428 RepID=A0A9P8C236_9HELO|nr:hypothetical protein BJ875DRAFT_470782 [Amylocarpus encephaloides]